MKKVLLGTSAIALAGAFSTSANAVEWNVVVGGYAETYAAYAAPDVDGFSGDSFDGVDNKIESEVHFKPSITLDNGIKFGANIELEGAGGSGTPDTIDEQYIFVDGSFGRMLFGSENSAGYLMTYGAPDVTFVNVNSGSLPNFIPFSGFVGNPRQVGVTPGFPAAGGVFTGSDIFRGTLGSTFLENARNNDAQRFTYFTPRFGGFQLGVSYARDPNQDTNQQLNTEGLPLSDIFDVGANYVNSFGAFDVAISGRYGMANDDRNSVAGTDIGDNPEVFGGGLNLGYGGFTIGGSWAEQNDAGALDGTAWDAGVSYETGPWGVSFTYFHGENVDNENVFNPLGNDEEVDQYLLGVSYDLAKGVALNGFGAYVNFDEDCGDAGCGAGAFNAGGDDVDGWVVGTGLKLSW